MNKFDAQTLKNSGINGDAVILVFENEKAEEFMVTMPTAQAIAMGTVLDGMRKHQQLKAEMRGAYLTQAGVWRVGHDIDSRRVLLEVQGHAPFVFSIAGANALSQQLREQCAAAEALAKPSAH